MPKKISKPDRASLTQFASALLDIDRLRQEITVLEHQEQEAKGKVDQLRKVGQSEQGKYNDLTKFIASSKLNCALLVNDHQSFDSTSQQLVFDIKKIDASSNRHKQELLALSHHLQEALHQHKKLDNPWVKIESEIAGATNKLKTIKHETLILQRLRDQQERDFWSLKAVAKDLHKQRARLARELQDLISEIGSATSDQRPPLEKKHRTLQQQLDELNALIRTTEARVNALEDSLDELVRAHQDMGEELQALTQQLSLLNNALRKIDDQRDELVRKEHALTQSSLLHEKKLTQQEQQRAGLNEKIEGLKASIYHNEMEQERLTAKIQQAVDEQSQKNIEIKSIKRLFDQEGENKTKISVLLATRQKERLAITTLATKQASDARQILDAAMITFDDGVATFGNGLALIPPLSVQALNDLNPDRMKITHEMHDFDNFSLAQRYDALMRCFTLMDGLVDAYVAAATSTKQYLADQYDLIVKRIHGSVRGRIRGMGAAILPFVDNNLKQQGNLNDAVVALFNNQNYVLLNEATLTTQAEALADEYIRRYDIFRIRAQHALMCYTARVPPVLKQCLAAGSTVAHTRTAVDALRLTPDIGEWRKAMGAPRSGEWFMWGTKSAFDGIEIHATISDSSIQLPAAIGPTAAALCTALCGLPLASWWQEAHATLLIEPDGSRQHPACFFSGRSKKWAELESFYARTMTAPDAALKRQNAENAVDAFLTQYVTHLRSLCQQALTHLAAGRDILGNTLP